MNTERLSNEEVQGLREVTKQLGLRLDPDIQSLLMSKGLIEQVLGGLKVTPAGSQELRRQS